MRQVSSYQVNKKKKKSRRNLSDIFQILANNTLVSQYQVYFRTRKTVAIDTVPKETQEEAVTGVLLHLWLILREAKIAL